MSDPTHASGPVPEDGPTTADDANAIVPQANIRAEQPVLPVFERTDSEPNEGAEAAWEASDPWWRSATETALAFLAESGRSFDVDDVRALGVGEPDHPCAWGHVFVAARRAGTIECIGATPATRPSRHRSLNRRWRGVSRNAGDGAQ